jgi:hypothetical protein
MGQAISVNNNPTIVLSDRPNETNLRKQELEKQPKMIIISG